MENFILLFLAFIVLVVLAYTWSSGGLDEKKGADEHPIQLLQAPEPALYAIGDDFELSEEPQLANEELPADDQSE